MQRKSELKCGERSRANELEKDELHGEAVKRWTRGRRMAHVCRRGTKGAPLLVGFPRLVRLVV